MHKFLLLLFILLVQSCNSLEGEFHIYKTFSLRNSSGTHVVLEHGVHPAKLELKSSRLFSIKYFDQPFMFKIPKGNPLPEGDVEIRLSSKEVGQEFGVYARVSSKIFHGEQVQDIEQCSWVERYDFCNEGGICSVRYRTREGVKDVMYRSDIYEKKVALNLNVETTGEVVSQFLGENTFVKKIYIYESNCL